MSKRTNFVVVSAMLVVTLGLVGTAVVQAGEPPTPAPLTTKQLTTREVKQLLFLMDTDKDGKISKQEFMNFMGAEFDRLDTDKNGYLDVNEMKYSHFRGASAVGK